MHYARLKTVKEWVKDGMGTCDSDDLTKAVNRIRQHMFGWYQDLALFLDAVECFTVQRFCADCDKCNESYRGVTLPRYIQNVEAMWFNDFPVSLQSSWREFQTGISSECDCRLIKYDVPGTFSTQLDIQHSRPSFVAVRALSHLDAGKKFTIRGVDQFDRPFSQEFKLTTTGERSTEKLKRINPTGGVFKERTEGRVFLTDEGCRMLGVYEPDEEDATYRRIKISGLGDDCEVVNIRGARRFVNLYGDDDCVETDNELAFDSMARYLRIYQKSERTGDDTKAMAEHYNLAKQMLAGEKSRDIGKGTAAGLTFITPRMPRPALNRFGRRRF